MRELFLGRQYTVRLISRGNAEISFDDLLLSKEHVREKLTASVLAVVLLEGLWKREGLTAGRLPWCGGFQPTDSWHVSLLWDLERLLVRPRSTFLAVKDIDQTGMPYTNTPLTVPRPSEFVERKSLILGYFNCTMRLDGLKWIAQRCISS